MKIEDYKIEVNEELITKSKDLLVQANEMIVINNNDEELIAKGYMDAANELKKAIVNHHKEMKEQAHKLHKTICAKESEQLEAPQNVISICSKAIGTYRNRLAEEARKKAEEERKRIEAERIKEAERKAKAAELLRNQGLAEEAEKMNQEAEDILDMPEPVVEVEQPQKISGMKTQTYWKYEIVDPEKVPREFCMPDEKKIGGIVRTMKGKITIEGVRVYSETKSF